VAVCFAGAQGEFEMDYLLMKLLWYVVIAFVVGLFVGWYSCARVED
jgi:NhaP-type Na+/H+ or K+/H+ antiporter